MDSKTIPGMGRESVLSKVMQTEQEWTTFLLPWAAPTVLTAKMMMKMMIATTVLVLT